MSSRKQSLLETALALFLEHSYANTTIQMILDQSGVSKGTFYKFFSSKEDCLYSIIDQRMQEDVFIRKELEQNHYTSDYDLLVDQIAIPMSVPNKERVWELYWTGFYSGEINSAKLATVQLKWLSTRLIQVYGKDISLYANEGAILCYGILHQIANTSRSLNTQKPVWSEVVPKVLTYIEVILRTMHQRNEHIFDFQSLYFLNADERNHDMGLDIDNILERIGRVQQPCTKIQGICTIEATFERAFGAITGSRGFKYSCNRSGTSSISQRVQIQCFSSRSQ